MQKVLSYGGGELEIMNNTESVDYGVPAVHLLLLWIPSTVVSPRVTRGFPLRYLAYRFPPRLTALIARWKLSPTVTACTSRIDDARRARKCKDCQGYRIVPSHRSVRIVGRQIAGSAQLSSTGRWSYGTRDVIEVHSISSTTAARCD